MVSSLHPFGISIKGDVLYVADQWQPSYTEADIKWKVPS